MSPEFPGAGDGGGVEVTSDLNSPLSLSGAIGRIAAGAYGAIGARFEGKSSHKSNRMQVTMITKKEMSKRWRRTLFHLAFVLVVIFGVIISLVLDGVNGGEGPSIGTLAAIAFAFAIFSVVFFFVGRFIKNLIWRKFGED